jgi:hypothetical protein
MLRNGEGDSPPSNVTEVALADYPLAPASPIKDDSLSTLTSIFIRWDDVLFT